MNSTSYTSIIRKKRDGENLSSEEIKFFIKEMVDGRVGDAQVGAMLMAMYIKGLNDLETIHLTQSMVLSGSQLQWSSKWNGTLVDKHSTGGVGDKISLILAPILAACGLKVPMISGRSLEHTGGTLDKLESIPGFSVDLAEEDMKVMLEQAGCFICSATSQLCPADKIMYRVRDITCTVDYINLIVSSVISKKVASGVKFLILDVKVGKAAFCKTEDIGRALAKQLISVSGQLGVSARVVLSRMDAPLGNTAGNALEVAEAVQCLTGEMPKDIQRLTHTLAINLLEMTGFKGNAAELVKQVIEDGTAMGRFKAMLLMQGVSEETVKNLVLGKPVLPATKYSTNFKVQMSGWISDVDAWKVGQVCLWLGGGRRASSDRIDPSVGVVLHKTVGDAVDEGDVWITVHHSTLDLTADTEQYIQSAITVEQTQCCKPDIIIDIIE